jgi:hypothetical protein
MVVSVPSNVYTRKYFSSEGFSTVNAVKNKLRNLKQETRTRAGKHPILLWSMYWPRPPWRKLLVVRKTQMVIEGFPRSGNTFAVEAFKQAQQDRVRVASHIHLPAQVIRAAQWRIPTLVLIREPADAVVSLLIREPEIALSQALKSYISFYETLMEYRNAYVLGIFEDVIKDCGAVIKQVNAKFGTQFAVFEHTEANVTDVFARCEETNRIYGKGLEMQVSRPSLVRNELKEPLRNALANPEHETLLSKARAIYGDLSKTGCS